MLWLILLALVAFAKAEYENFFFSVNGSCPGLGVRCEAPHGLCAYDNVARKYYCCSGHPNICRAAASECKERRAVPSIDWQRCEDGSGSWCCLDDEREKCPEQETTPERDACQATQPNPLADVSPKLLRETFASLSSANRTTNTFYPIDVEALSKIASAHSRDPATPPSGSSASNFDDSGILASAILGGVAFVALMFGAAWDLMRRKKIREALELHLHHPSAASSRDAEKNLPARTDAHHDDGDVPPVPPLDRERWAAWGHPDGAAKGQVSISCDPIEPRPSHTRPREFPE